MASPDDTMILETTKGKVTIAMRPDLAPHHVARIKELVRKGFYDGLVFHRVIGGFMAQGGDPTHARRMVALLVDGLRYGATVPGQKPKKRL